MASAKTTSRASCTGETHFPGAKLDSTAYFEYLRNVISITDHIEYLLRTQDCVIVPGWGAFIAQYSPARFTTGAVEPPARNIGFNGALTFGDGLLEGSVMRQQGCTYATAAEEIKENVTSLRQQVDISGEVAIGRLGIFRHNGEGELLFVPFEGQSVASQLYGLRDVSMSRLDDLRRATATRPSSAAGTLASVSEEEERRAVKWRIPARAKRYMQIAASVAVLIVLAFVLTTPLPVDNSTHDYAGMSDSFHLKKGGTTALAMEADALEHNGTGSVTEQSGTGTGQSPAVQEPPCCPTPSTLFNEGRYCLVVASGSTADEARRFISKQNGTALEYRILESEGRYRVYIASGKTFNDLAEVRGELITTYPDAWICVR